MSALKATPGPWSVTWNGPYAFVENLELDVEIFGAAAEGRTREEAQANAHLSAAAPDLYTEGEFLCERLREFEHVVDSETSYREFCGHIAPALARLEAALALARGEAL